MQTAIQSLRTRATANLLADIAGMIGLTVIVFGCLNLPTFL